ncbi:hypothetical protein TGP89_207960 [Toxoplasma gondii p89]|uniref:CCZ1/INTU/HSP4 first Longin domain-containing protein n=2 Tax=Toxoplasma gondii TaxID=5811 RepID=A0A086JEJ3_TOXGO|nr:hypothetical protein TGP89_207960 [Toxoplasma gondii p89]
MFSALSNVKARAALSRSSAAAAEGAKSAPPPLSSSSAADLLSLSSTLSGSLQARKECSSPPVPHSGVEAIFLFSPTLEPPRKAAPAPGCRATPPSSQSASRRHTEEDGGEDEDSDDEFSFAQGEVEARHESEEEEELGAEERAQEAKIVFYFPASRPAEEKRSHVGLIEGLTIFTQQFSGDAGPLRSIYTDAHVVVTKEVEPDYWLTLVFNACELGGPASTSEGVKGGVDAKANRLADFGGLDEDNQEIILMGILDKFYQYFRLLHGRFALFVERGNRQHLSDLVEDYCPAFLDTIDPQNLSLFHRVDGFHFGPLDRLPYLHLPSFVSVLQNKFPCILHAALLLNGCLLFSNVSSGPNDFAPSSSALSGRDAGSPRHGNSFTPPKGTVEGSPPADAAASSAESARRVSKVRAGVHAEASENGEALQESLDSSEAPHAERERNEKATLERGRQWQRKDDFSDGYDVMRVLYSYLVHAQGCAAVDPGKLRKPPYARVNTAAARPGGGCSSFGRALREVGSSDSFEDTPSDAFLFGPTGASVFLPVIHLPDDSTGSLVVINHKQLQLVLVLSDAAHQLVNDASFLQHVRSFALEAGLGELQQAFSVAFDDIMKQEDAYRFIYFNHVNRAVRISNKRCPANAPSPPSFPGCALSKLEVRRMGQLHRHLRAAVGEEEDFHFGFPEACSEESLLVCGRSSRVDSHAEGCRCGESRKSSEGREEVQSKKDGLPPGEEAEGFADEKALHAEERSASSSEEARLHRAGSDGRGLGGDVYRRSKPEKTQVKPVPVKLIAVKDALSGWLIGSASMDREFYVALDDPRTTLSRAVEDASRFGYMHFANIFV